MSNQRKQPKRDYFFYIRSGIILLVMSILGNLASGWIQADWMKNNFTLGRVIFIFSFLLIGILITAFIEKSSDESSLDKDTGECPNNSNIGGVMDVDGDNIDFQNNVNRWGKMKVRGTRFGFKNNSNLLGKMSINIRGDKTSPDE